MSVQVQRQERGSILVLCMVLISLIAFALVVGYSFWGLLFVNSRLHTAADEIALTGAKRLNDRDRLGQMNNMILRCRQMVFNSRLDFKKSQNEGKDLADFADELLKESQDSARDLETERKNVLGSAKKDANTAMTDRFNKIKDTFPMQLPWLIVDTPKFSLDGFGKIKEMDSNVEELDKIPELTQKDRSDKYVKEHKSGLSLYEAESDGTLPEESNLVFRLSSLPAPVKNTIAPSRTFLQTKFQKEKTEGPEGHFPSSIKVTLRLGVATGLGPKASSNMEATGTAITTGALPQR